MRDIRKISFHIDESKNIIRFKVEFNSINGFSKFKREFLEFIFGSDAKDAL
ncbi:MAG: hypothetical protein ACTSPQ_21915 [Candidatus Helarchaeota archaeon]